MIRLSDPDRIVTEFARLWLEALDGNTLKFLNQGRSESERPLFIEVVVQHFDAAIVLTKTILDFQPCDFVGVHPCPHRKRPRRGRGL
jgi:hypothetical protein